MQRICAICNRTFEARRKDARYCGSTCRNSRARGAKPLTDLGDSPLVKATRTELEAAGKLDTMLGQQALILAARMSGTETAGGVGTLSKELSRVVAAATGTTPPGAPATGKGDSVDELRARRDAKRAG